MDSITDAPSGELPTPKELAAFLRTEVGWADVFDPDQLAGTVFFSNVDCDQSPFTVGFIDFWRRRTRDALRESPEHREERAFLLKQKPTAVELTAEDLFLVAGGGVSPGQRLRVCLDLIGVTQFDADAAANPDSSGSKALNEFLQSEARSYASLSRLCCLIGVDEEWIKFGVGFAGMSRPPPMWLDPWSEAYRQAALVFDCALQCGGLRFSGGGVPVDQDFLAFWQWWQRHPRGLLMPTVSTSQDRFLAAWIFVARHAYRRGDETWNVTCTPRTFDILTNLVRYHLRLRTGRQAGDSGTSDDPGPTLEDLMELQRWLASPPGLTKLQTGTGPSVAISPSNRPPLERLPSQIQRPRRGRKRGDGGT